MQVAAEGRAVPCLVVLVAQGALVGLARLRDNHRSPSGDGATRVCHRAWPVFQALFVSSFQIPRVLDDIQGMHRVKSPAGTADDGAHIVLFGTRGGRAAVVLQWGTLGTGGRGDIKGAGNRMSPVTAPH